MATLCPTLAAIATTSNGLCDQRKRAAQFSRCERAKTRASRLQLRAPTTLRWKVRGRFQPKQLQTPDPKLTGFSKATSQAMRTARHTLDSTSLSPQDRKST